MPANAARPKANAAVDYLNRLYQPDDRLAIVAVGRHGPDPKVEQRVVTARAAVRPGYQRFLRHLNATGHDIFVSMNPIRPETRSREKADVLEVRRLQLDLDKSGPESLRQVLADVNAGHLPAPAAVVRSSRQNYQVVWHADPGAWTPDAAEDAMRRLAGQYAGDSSVSDVTRVMRLPGFRNKKPERDDAPVVWTPHDGGPVQPDQFAHLPPPKKAAPVRREKKDTAQARALPVRPGLGLRERPAPPRHPGPASRRPPRDDAPGQAQPPRLRRAHRPEGARGPRTYPDPAPSRRADRRTTHGHQRNHPRKRRTRPLRRYRSGVRASPGPRPTHRRPRGDRGRLRLTPKHGDGQESGDDFAAEFDDHAAHGGG